MATLVQDNAAALDVTVAQYATFSLLVTVTDADTGDPVDFTGATLLLQARGTHDGPALIALTNGAGIAETDLVNGQFTLQMSATVTGALTSGRLLYDLTATYGSGQVDRILKGSIIVSPGVSHA